jgi:chorismate synthase
MRPGHADYAGYVKYRGMNDPRGGGHFSGRLTAPLVFAGSVARLLLREKGVTIGAHIAAIAGERDARFDPVNVDAWTLDRLAKSRFPLLQPDKEAAMREAVAAARAEKDSVGGVIECVIEGLPAGIGDPMFGGLENRIARTVFAIPAVKGVEFGAGFAAARLRGSENNDPFCVENGKIVTKTNHCGGILGGISNGMPVVFRAAFKPTPSISREQDSVSLSRMEETKLVIHGRHDPCIVPRAVPCVEAAAAIAVLDAVMERKKELGYGY